MYVLIFVSYFTRASRFSSDKMFPALGFGARIPPDFKVCPLLFTYFSSRIAPWYKISPSVLKTFIFVNCAKSVLCLLQIFYQICQIIQTECH